MLVVERRPAERVDVGVRGRLAERDLAGRRTGRERRGYLPRPGRDPRSDVGQAGAALTGAEARLAGALEQLELLEALVPGGLEVRDGRAHARADHALGRRRREGRFLRRSTDHGQWHLAGHPGQQVPRSAAQAEDHGVGRHRRLGAGRLVDGHDRVDPTRLALEAHQPPRYRRRGYPLRRRPDRNGLPERHARRVQLLRGARRQQAAQLAPGHDRVDLGRPGRDHDLVGVDVEHPRPCAHDEHRAGVDRHDLVARGRIQHEHRLARPLPQSPPPRVRPIPRPRSRRRRRGARPRSGVRAAWTRRPWPERPAVPGARRSDAPRPTGPVGPASGRFGRMRRHRPSRGSSRSRRRGTGSRHDPATDRLGASRPRWNRRAGNRSVAHRPRPARHRWPPPVDRSLAHPGTGGIE